jgi:prevent-host-death family protein
MKRASVTEAKNNLSALIDGLKSGSPVLIVDRGRPVARLEPVGARGDESEPDGRLSRLFRDGVVRPGRRGPARSLFSSPPPQRADPSVSALDALLQERREGR